MSSSMFPNWPVSSINAEMGHKASEAAYEGDLAWWDSSNHCVRSAANLTDSGNGATQLAFAAVFVGVFNSRQLATDAVAHKARVVIDGIWEFPCVANTFTVGDYVEVAYSAGAVSQQVAKTTDSTHAIGTVVKEYTSSTTLVKVRLRSLILGAVSQYSVQTALTATSLTSTGASFAFDALNGATGGTITINGGTSSTGAAAGGAVSMIGGSGGAAGTGGAANVTGGVPSSGNATGGAANITGGAGSGTGLGGAVNITGGVNGSTATSNAAGAVVITGGAASSTNSAGGAVNLVGGLGIGTGAGGAINLTSGAAGATGVAGAIAIAVGAATAGAGSSITITGGNGAGGTAAGGNVNLVAGTAVSTGTPGEVQVNADSNLILISEALTATDATRTVFVATRACRFKSVKAVFSTASSSGTLQIEKCTGTTAPGSGTNLLTGTVSLAGTANTVVSGTLIGTVASLTLAAGDRLSIVIAGTMTSLAGGRISLGICPT